MYTVAATLAALCLVNGDVIRYVTRAPAAVYRTVATPAVSGCLVVNLTVMSLSVYERDKLNITQ